jgi:hypothetical protein
VAAPSSKETQQHVTDTAQRARVQGYCCWQRDADWYVEALPTCPAISSVHWCSWPTPGAVKHCASTWSTVTVQLTAVYSRWGSRTLLYLQPPSHNIHNAKRVLPSHTIVMDRITGQGLQYQ